MTLKCQIQICHKDDASSVCKVAGKACGCAAGYYSSGGKCVENKCKCDNGVGASHLACSTNGNKKCVKCNSGYMLSPAYECKKALYDFKNFTFTNCGKTGRLGPSPAECRKSYASTNQSWVNSSSYY